MVTQLTVGSVVVDQVNEAILILRILDVLYFLFCLAMQAKEVKPQSNIIPLHLLQVEDSISGCVHRDHVAAYDIGPESRAWPLQGLASYLLLSV